VLSKGHGSVHPRKGNSITVRYAGWTTDGRLFDSSYAQGEAATFSLAEVIPEWSEGLQLMVVGKKRRLWVPEELGYKGHPDRPKGMLVFDVELVDIGVAAPPRSPANAPEPDLGAGGPARQCSPWCWSSPARRTGAGGSFLAGWRIEGPCDRQGHIRAQAESPCAPGRGQRPERGCLHRACLLRYAAPCRRPRLRS